MRDKEERKRDVSTMRAPGSDHNHPDRQARLRGLHQNRRPLGSPAHVPLVRACRLLRLVEEQARHQALSARSEEHTSELQSQFHLVCRLLLEKKKKNNKL